MSAVTVWQGLAEAFRTIDGLHAILLGEPTSIQATPLLYAGYASADQLMRSQAPARNLDGITHIFAVRLVFDYQDNDQAEMQLLTLADSVPSAINRDPRLGGRLSGGVAKSISATSGFAMIAKKLYRILEFTVSVTEKRSAA
jgi:hypothetical protein